MNTQDSFRTRMEEMRVGIEKHFSEMTPEDRAKLDAARAKDDADKAEQKRMLPFVRSGISRRLGADDIDKIASGAQYDTASLKSVRKWIVEARKPEGERMSWWGPCLWLGGPRGVGKTMAAAWAIHEMLHVDATYITFLELCRIAKHRESFKTAEAEEAEERFERIAKRPLLVLDEVGQESEAIREMAKITLHDLVDIRRHVRGLTLVLSNKSGDTIRQRFADDWYDSRTESRLRQLLTRDANGKGLHDIKGEDLRGEPI